MWPTIGSLRTYMVFYVLSMIVHMWLAIRLCRKRGVTWKAGLGLGLCYTWGMCVGAKILYDLLNGRLDWRNYLDISYYFGLGAWGGPLAYLAVAVAGVLVLARDRRMMLDIVVLALPVPMILAKVACFVNGCCYGAESTVPWAMALAHGARGPAGIPRHPTPLYEILVLVVIMIVLAKLDNHRWKGTLVAWFVLLYGLGRPLTELFRAAGELRMPVGPFSASQLTCLTAAVVAAASLPFLRLQHGTSSLASARDSGESFAEPP
ncbi:MAG: prolipoprotein diacylglyceryl transferase [Phycisphaerae bacterium]